MYTAAAAEKQYIASSRHGVYVHRYLHHYSFAARRAPCPASYVTPRTTKIDIFRRDAKRKIHPLRVLFVVYFNLVLLRTTMAAFPSSLGMTSESDEREEPRPLISMPTQNPSPARARFMESICCHSVHAPPSRIDQNKRNKKTQKRHICFSACLPAA